MYAVRVVAQPRACSSTHLTFRGLVRASYRLFHRSRIDHQRQGHSAVRRARPARAWILPSRVGQSCTAPTTLLPAVPAVLGSSTSTSESDTNLLDNVNRTQCRTR
ncbi:hypothetical protein FKP32DRAFT_690545 [Trametes sanguinea]|nr:hypothetical protein FKP32DRAFT_690545 [Trametes sanguinea]